MLKTALSLLFTAALASTATAQTLSVEKLVPKVRVRNGAFSTSVAMSADGKTVIAGAIRELKRKGAAYLFQKTASGWTSRKFIARDLVGKPGIAEFGKSVAMSADGKTFLVGSPYDSSRGKWSGAVYVYRWTGSDWASKKIIPRGLRAGDYFGKSIGLSADGKTFVAGAENTNSRGTDSGAAYVFTRRGKVWKQTRLREKTPRPYGRFGLTVAISGDGRSVAVHQSKTGPKSFAGSVTIFERGTRGWRRHSVLKLKAGARHAMFGKALSFSTDGRVLAVAAPQQSIKGTLYVFLLKGKRYEQSLGLQHGPIKGHRFSSRVRLTANGKTLVTAVTTPASAGSTPTGEIWIYPVSGSAWQRRQHAAVAPTSHAAFGSALALSPDGAIVAVGAKSQDWKGAVFIFR